MASYTFARELVNGGYNINNILNVDGGDQEILLWTDIYNSSIAKKCNICCCGSEVIITFDTDLSAPEQATLDGLVSTYKSVT
jgi:hypothetical protein